MPGSARVVPMPPDAPAPPATPKYRDSGADLLDVVDAEDRVIGVASRADVHALSLRHRSVHILVHDGRGRFYVQRRSEFKDCQPGLWDTSAAGHVDHGEDYHVAAPRELAEELGLHGLVLTPVASLPASADTGFEFVRVYAACANAEPQPDPGEIAEARWCDRDELARWIAREPERFTASFRCIFARCARDVARMNGAQAV